MVDLSEYIDEMLSRSKRNEAADRNTIITFLIDNAWFGSMPDFKDGKVFLTSEQINLYTPPLLSFLDAENPVSSVSEMMKKRFNATYEQFEKFMTDNDRSENSEERKLYIYDFLLFRLNKDLSLYSNKQAEELIGYAVNDLNMEHGNLLTFFMSWLNSKRLSSFNKDFVLEKRYSMSLNNTAYDITEYLKLLYYIINDDRIQEEEMFKQAAESQAYTDTWLFLLVHYIASLRLTDLERIYHPRLPYPPDEVIRMIAEDSFTENDSRLVLLSITDKLDVLHLSPHKTTNGKPGMHTAIKFEVPTSCEHLFGRLFALAEAHRQINGTPDAPIIRKVTSYKEIKRTMGEEIGELFLYKDFSPRAATKSYLQMLDSVGEDILRNKGYNFKIKGSVLASLARGHKGGFGEFAGTTMEYLKDAALSGLTPEFVAFELLERGVLSSIPSMLLGIVFGNEYKESGYRNQTKLISSLNMHPDEIDKLVEIVSDSREKSRKAVVNFISDGDSEEILLALHRIGTGEAFSKTSDSCCLYSAFSKVCPYADKMQCINCEYEISTRSTFFFIIGEVKRFRRLYTTVESEAEKKKYRVLLERLIAKTEELINEIASSYGMKTAEEYLSLLKELVEEEEKGA